MFALPSARLPKLIRAMLEKGRLRGLSLTASGEVTLDYHDPAMQSDPAFFAELQTAFRGPSVFDLPGHMVKYMLHSGAVLSVGIIEPGRWDLTLPTPRAGYVERISADSFARLDVRVLAACVDPGRAGVKP